MRRFLTSFVLLLTPFVVYGQDLSKGHTFNDGDTVHASDLNTLVDSANILETFISNKGTATPLASDFLLFDQVSTSTLKRAAVSDVLSAGSAVVTSTNRNANTFLGGPATGAATAPTFRLLKPADLSVPTAAVAASTIDCSTSNTFTKTLTTNTSFTLSNIPNGAVVTIAVRQAAAGGPYTATFPGVFWRGGTAPTQTVTPSKIDLYTFIAIGGIGTLGSASQNY